MTADSHHIVAHLFRKEYGKLVATLTRIFGASHIQLAEDIVQETLITAMDHWSVKGIPENPSAWLIQVAKRKVFNELKRNKMKKEHHWNHVAARYSKNEIGTIFLQGEIEDNQLRMIFTCCHPAINLQSQIALTLKTLCGFGVKEVAKALLTTESTISKRLYRAKTNIRELGPSFEIPSGKQLENRLDVVTLTLYLLFNEGYNSSANDSLIRRDLCLEAIRLTKLLANRFDENKKIFALLSLMCFHTARFDARIDKQGALVLFEDQDRSLWNQELIVYGMQYLQKSAHDKTLSTYHIEANIAAEHCTARDFDGTNWKNIHKLYMLLQHHKPSAIIKLNLAIIESKLKGLQASLLSLQKLNTHSELKNYHLLPATQGIFHMKLHNYEQAIFFLGKALSLRPSPTEHRFLLKKIEICEKRLRASKTTQ
ncbi:RNA polymerase sigma factor [Spongiimicrobium sp. 3-5]|uniref:RNA polymerase sigma factor n=1 Tax=Spongiimicrobium sp. 3-5 TaxID=3332596 RepID=UPI00397EA2C1